MPSEGAQKRKFELTAAESSKSSTSVERKGEFSGDLWQCCKPKAAKNSRTWTWLSIRKVNPQVLHPAFWYEFVCKTWWFWCQTHGTWLDLRYWTCDLGHGHSWLCGCLGIMMVGGVREWRVGRLPGRIWTSEWIDPGCLIKEEGSLLVATHRFLLKESRRSISGWHHRDISTVWQILVSHDTLYMQCAKPPQKGTWSQYSIHVLTFVIKAVLMMSFAFIDHFWGATSYPPNILHLQKNLIISPPSRLSLCEVLQKTWRWSTGTWQFQSLLSCGHQVWSGTSPREGRCLHLSSRFKWPKSLGDRKPVTHWWSCEK